MEMMGMMTKTINNSSMRLFAQALIHEVIRIL
jgi:hypothetical protein